MANTCISLNIHIIFSTKDRTPMINAEWRERLWAYLGGIARENKMRALEIGGVADHVHMLVSLPSTLSMAKAVQLLKGNSSKWINETFPGNIRFQWQEGYGAFSVSSSQIKATVEYIQGQEGHHRKKSFQEEYLAFLKKHGVSYDERYLWE
ncbi:MAG: IS200/IS605 family transposase [Chthoniobacteraceae bacterium]